MTMTKTLMAFAGAVLVAALLSGPAAAGGKYKHHWGKHHAGKHYGSKHHGGRHAYGHRRHGYGHGHKHGRHYRYGHVGHGAAALAILSYAAKPTYSRPRGYVAAGRHRVEHRACHRVTRIGHAHGRRARLGGTMCYDAYNRGYIVKGSRYVIAYLPY